MSMLVVNLKKSRFYTKFRKNLDCGRNFQKMSNLVEIFGKISIMVEIVENLDLGRNFPKVLILVQIFKKSRFW